MLIRTTIAIVLLAALLSAPAYGQTSNVEWDERAAALNERLREARRADDPRPIAEHLLDALGQEPALVAELESRGVSALVVNLDRVGAHDLQTRVLSELIEEDWRPAGTISPRPETYDVQYALRLLESGDVLGATRILLKLHDVSSHVAVMIDRRFEALWPTFEGGGWLDARAAVEREVEEAAALSAAYPRRLEAINLHLSALRRAGRPEEAVAAGADARAAIEAGRLDDFDDAPNFANWVMEEIAMSLEVVGDHEEGRRVRDLAATLGESGEDDNVSQVLNGATALMWDGEAEAALDRVASFAPDDVSRYGWTVVLYVRACSYAQLGDAGALAASLQALDDARADGARAAVLGYLCAGDTERAAETMIWQLGADHARLGLLRTLQRVVRPSVVESSPEREPAPTEFAQRVNAEYAQIFARRDVLEALDQAGRVLTWDVAALR